MIVCKLLLTVFFWIYLQLALLIVSLISYPAWLLPDHGRWLVYSLERLVLRCLFLVSFIRVKLTGLTNLPPGSRLIYFANKPNFISTLALIAYLPQQVHFVANQRMFKFFLLGRIICSMGCIPAADGKERAMGFAAEILKALKRGEAVLFYPANIRSADATLRPFKDVELKIASLCQAKVVPLAVKGAEQVFGEAGALVSPGRIEISFGQPGSTIQEFDSFYRSELYGN